MENLSLPVQFITSEELCRRFNEGRYWERAQGGEFSQRVRRNGHPSPPLAEEPFCTRSQIIAYYDAGGSRVAIIHQYLRPDNTIGLSGLAEPKCLLSGGVLYKVLYPQPTQEEGRIAPPGGTGRTTPPEDRA